MYVLEFGNRTGSFFTLTLFGVLFLVMSLGVWREIRRRAPGRKRLAAVAAILLFAGPMALIYASSLNGFYEAEVRDGHIVLRYLFPTTTEIPLREIETIRVAPAFKGRWRLHIIRSKGVQYESATWHRDAVNEAATRLRALTDRE